MRTGEPERDEALIWDVARPRRLSRVGGVAMAGFRDRVMAPKRFRLVPHPAVTVIVDFGAVPPVLYDAAGRQHRGSLVAGAGLGAGFGSAVWGSGANLACVQVRLSPLVAGEILGARPAELDDTVVSLADLWGADASRIAEQLAEVSTWEERFALVDRSLAGRRAALPVDPEVAWAWERIVGSRGLVRVDQLAAELGWSRKRLWARFGSQIGMPPKRAAKLVRFDHAAHRLAAGQDVARVAASSGYTDQSHLHRDVRAFTGVTPTAVADEPFLAVDDIAWTGNTTPTKTPA